MPILNLELFLALLGCFATGMWLAAALERRRFRREVQRRERDMSEALRARYLAYEGLEHSVQGLISKFDALESEFRTKLAVATNPGILTDQTVTLRSTNPELWDLEREHQRERSQNLSEISRQSRRIAELMEQMPALEAAQEGIRSELVHTHARYENAVANATEAEQALTSKVARLEQRLGELQPLESILDSTRRDLDAARTAHSQARSNHDQIVVALQQRITALQPFEARVAELEHDISEQGQAASQKELEIAKLEGELEKAAIGHTKAEMRCKQLDEQSLQSRKALEEANATLQATRLSQAQLSTELGLCRADLQAAQKREAQMREQLETARDLAQTARAEAESKGMALEEQSQGSKKLHSSLTAAQAEIALYRAKLNAHSSQVGQAWSLLSELKPMLVQLEDRLKDSDEPPPALPASPANAHTPSSAPNLSL